MIPIWLPLQVFNLISQSLYCIYEKDSQVNSKDLIDFASLFFNPFSSNGIFSKLKMLYQEFFIFVISMFSLKSFYLIFI